MPVTSGQYKNNETLLYQELRNQLGFNTAIICGLLANAQKESAFNTRANGDSGTSTGLFQWHKTRKTALINYCNSAGIDPYSVKGQVMYLKYELNNSESNARKKIEGLPNTAQGAYDAGYNFCYYFERPANKAASSRERGEIARSNYWPFYSPLGGDVSSDIGYGGGGSVDAWGTGVVTGGKLYCRKGPSKSNAYWGKFNDGQTIPIKEYNTDWYMTYWNNIVNTGYVMKKFVTNIQFQSNSGGSSGSGGSSVANPTVGSGSIADVIEFDALTVNDIYAPIVQSNLSVLETIGYDYGYLMDISHGGVFRFYIPDFSEKAGANWSSVKIPGRSAEIRTYESTDSRSVSIDLELYAGVGFYSSPTEDVVGKMYSDINFVRSLEYPDYSNSVAAPPPAVHLIIGPVLEMVGVVSSVSVEHKAPIDRQGRSMYVKLSFTVTQIAANPPDYRDIRNSKYAMSSAKDSSSFQVGNTVSSNINNSAG